MVGALPGRALEAAGGQAGERRALRQLVLDRFEGRADIVAQALEPSARALFAGFQTCPASMIGSVRNYRRRGVLAHGRGRGLT